MVAYVTQKDLHNLYIPPNDSHKGQNGKLLIIGGSTLFHAASLWSLTVASRIVDLVHYSSVPSNNEIVQKAKEVFKNGIVVPREDIESYIEEDDCILIGPGMVRSEIKKLSVVPTHSLRVNSDQLSDLDDILRIENEGEQTYYLTNYLLRKYPHKQWVIDAGALQMVDVSLIPNNAILTPHQKEFFVLCDKVVTHTEEGDENILDPLRAYPGSDDTMNAVSSLAKHMKCIILLKGVFDIASNSSGDVHEIKGGNAGMTKGGTGDVLAGLIAALACKNDPMLATVAGSFINKAAGDELYKTVGPYFNASDLAEQIPKTMTRLIGG